MSYICYISIKYKVCLTEGKVSSNGFKYISNKNAGRVLCFVGGYVDAAGYVLLDTLFVASITGNVIKYSAAASMNSFALGYIIISIAYGNLFSISY